MKTMLGEKINGLMEGFSESELDRIEKTNRKKAEILITLEMNNRYGITTEIPTVSEEECNEIIDFILENEKNRVSDIKVYGNRIHMRKAGVNEIGLLVVQKIKNENEQYQ